MHTLSAQPIKNFFLAFLAVNFLSKAFLSSNASENDEFCKIVLPSKEALEHPSPALFDLWVYIAEEKRLGEEGGVKQKIEWTEAGDNHFSKKEYPEAFKFYCLASLITNSETQYNLGLMYEKGLGVEMDKKRALEWYEAAAKQQHSNAQYKAGKLNMPSEPSMLPKDYPYFQSSVGWYTLAANQGHAKAQCELGIMYIFEWGVEISFKKTIELLGACLEKSNYNKAQFYMGLLYENGPENGEGFKQSFKEAVKWYKLAAHYPEGDNGYAEAQYRLGLMYEWGKGVKFKSLPTARQWYQLSANQGFSEAIMKLEHMQKDVGTLLKGITHKIGSLFPINYK